MLVNAESSNKLEDLPGSNFQCSFRLVLNGDRESQSVMAGVGLSTF